MKIWQMIKTNRTLLMALVASVTLVVLSGTVYYSQVSEKQGLKEKHTELINKLDELDLKIATRQAELDKQKNEVVVESTGLDPALVEQDGLLAKSFFEPAFNWTNGTSYDKAREKYMDYLGEDNTFTKVYLPEDTKIDTNDGKLSYIDFKKLKARSDAMDFVPLKVEGNKVYYVGFVNYYMYKDERDLSNTSALEPSNAVIRFAVIDDAEDGRRIIDVEAWAGFASSDEFNQ